MRQSYNSRHFFFVGVKKRDYTNNAQPNTYTYITNKTLTLKNVTQIIRN